MKRNQVPSMSSENHRFCNYEANGTEQRFYHSYIIYSDHLVFLKRYYQSHRNYLSKEQQIKNLRNKSYNGYMSKATISKVRKVLDTWEQSIDHYNSLEVNKFKKDKRRIVFLTLTLSSEQEHDDYTIKRRLLIPFIAMICEKYEVKHYFWKAEKQTNGNIHFHLLIDHYIDKRQVQILWNSVQNRLGYIDKFESRYNHRQPPSTEIHLPSKGNTVVNYLLAYLVKEEMNGKVEGRIWGMSDALREIKPVEIEACGVFDEEITKLVATGRIEVMVREHCTILYFKKPCLLSVDTEHLRKYLENEYHEIYRKLYTNFVPKLSIANEYRMLEAEKVPIEQLHKQLVLFE